MNGKTLAYIVKRNFIGCCHDFCRGFFTFWFMQLIPGGPFTKEKMPSGGTWRPFGQEIWTR
jgi:hypothetical protein